LLRNGRSKPAGGSARHGPFPCRTGRHARPARPTIPASAGRP